MDFMTIILAVVAVYVFKPAFFGTGKLMQIENVKEGKEKVARKGLRICYLIMFFCSVFMILITLAQNKGFTVSNYKVTFNGAYTAADGTSYEEGQVITLNEEGMNALYALPESQKPAESSSSASGFSCMPSASNYASVPCKYEPIYEATEFGAKFPGKDAGAKFKFVRTMSVVFFAISLADIVFMMVFINKMTDKKKKAKAQAAAVGRRASMPSNAFSFDDDEPVAPDDPKVSDPEE